MKFTIITTNKNGSRFLEETIRSVISQKGSGVDLEYIVIDGGSTDDSLEIIRHYEQDISQIISEPDRGPVSAINKGLRLASGEIVAWLNADDRYHPGALKKVAQVMAAHPKRALCFGACRIVDEEGREIRRGITRFKEAFFRFLHDLPFNVSTTSPSRRCFSAVLPWRLPVIFGKIW